MEPDLEPPDEPEPPAADPIPLTPVGRPWVGRDDIGEDGLCRWERDELARYQNTGDAAFLHSILDDGSPPARARAARLIELRPQSPEPPSLPPPQPDFRERAAALVSALRRRRAQDRTASAPNR